MLCLSIIFVVVPLHLLILFYLFSGGDGESEISVYFVYQRFALFSAVLTQSHGRDLGSCTAGLKFDTRAPAFAALLTDTANDIAAKRAEALQMDRERGEEKGIRTRRKLGRRFYEPFKEKADKERELQGNKEGEKERNERFLEEELKQKVLLLKDGVDRAKKRKEVERSKEFRKSMQQVAAEKEFEQEIFRRKDELDQELKRMKMTKEGRNEEEAKRKHLRRKILRRENDLDRASLVKSWKASAAELPSFTSTEEPTVAEQILEAAKRGPKHDLCEACGRKLRFCVHEECSIIGCVGCFDEYFVACLGCANFVCEQHWIKCFACEAPNCNQCDGIICEFCEAYTCAYCHLCDLPRYCCPERNDMCEKSQSAESFGHNFSIL